MAGFTRLQIREHIARFFGSHFGTVVSATTTSITDDVLPRYADNYFLGSQVWIQEQTAFVTDFDSASGTLTFSPALTFTPSAGDTYRVFRVFTEDEINWAISGALAGAEIATSIVPDTEALDYNLYAAPGLRRAAQMRSVWVREHNRTDSLPRQVVGWQMEDADTLLTLRLPYRLNADDGFWIVYELEAWDMELTDDCDLTNIPMEVLISRSMVHLLASRLAGSNGDNLSHWGQQLQYWRERKDRAEIAWRRQASKREPLRWDDISGGTSRALASLGLEPIYETV